MLIVENNQYAYSTPLIQQMAIGDIAVRAEAHGVPAEIVDGNDVEAVRTTVEEAVERARQGDGPSMIECKTMRMLGHAIHDGAEYVPAELLAEWSQRDPILRFERVLLEDGLMTEEDLAAVADECRDRVAAAVAFAESSDWPDPRTVLDGVYAP